MMNDAALKKMGWMLSRMERESSKRNAPVLRAETSTKHTPFMILVFTMLSARTKDETTIKVVDRLFKIARTPEQMSSLGRPRLEKILYGVGFYRMKAKNLLETSRILKKRGNVPDTLEELLQLPGIGRKTANIILARAFGKNALGVDVHVHRISNRLEIVKTKKPEETEKALVAAVPGKYIRRLNRSFVAFGQTVCLPRNPQCSICPINKICKRIGVNTKQYS